jgi:hypothetical protein
VEDSLVVSGLKAEGKVGELEVMSVYAIHLYIKIMEPSTYEADEEYGCYSPEPV